MYLFSFRLASGLSQAESLVFKFKDMSSVRVTSCYVNSVKADCESLSNPTPAFPLPTVGSLAGSESVLVIVPGALAAGTEHRLQVTLANDNPALARLSQLF